MKNANISIDFKSLPEQLGVLGQKLVRYMPLMVFVLIALVYGFVLVRITMLANAQPNDSTVVGQIADLTPHIDQNAVRQLQSLEDNSVNVQSLFEDARNNPFGE